MDALEALSCMEVEYRERAKKVRKAEKRLIKKIEGIPRLYDRLDDMDQARRTYERMARNIRRVIKSIEKTPKIQVNSVENEPSFDFLVFCGDVGGS
jgi:small-conductance mechanosensitive channel